MKRQLIIITSVFLLQASCQFSEEYNEISPVLISQPVPHDSEDPAIWYNSAAPEESLVLGTDKDTEGALYVFNLSGEIQSSLTITGLQYPNNVDIEYGLSFDSGLIDIAVITERDTSCIRVVRLPEMQLIDNGGINVFTGEEDRSPMGISLYKRPADGNIYAIVGRKHGPVDGSYLWQYLLQDSGSGYVEAVKVREFGLWSGLKEIESIAVDDENGYVYYSDEMYGVRKYYADPDSPEGSAELAAFGLSDFKMDVEGISVYKNPDGTGYILVSNQTADLFNVYTREGEAGMPHSHSLVKKIKLSTLSSDGSEILKTDQFPAFPGGLFVAMSDNRTFEFYSCSAILEEINGYEP